jgi:Protein export membrane protein
VLKDFAFAILIGISISAFSTIFIAAPFLAVLLERAPEYKSRAARPERRPEEEPEPEEKLVPVAAGVEGDGAPVSAPAAPAAQAQGPSGESKRERRRQRRRARPHGRAR